jgi:AraC-like DNA-binding protein
LSAFSDLIGMVRLEATIYHNAVVCGNWRLDEYEPGATCFHLVTQGECRLNVDGHLDTALKSGDLVIFPREISHSMTPVEQITGVQQHLAYAEAVNKNGTGVLCGKLRFQHTASSQLLDALPPVIVITHAQAQTWLAPIFALMLTESFANNATSSVILDRLSEILFIQALQHYIQNQNPHTGILALYGHPRLALALTAIHQSPETKWTLETMAKCAAQSRTQFAKTFRETSGWTPLQYLTWWRMQLAWSYLRDGLSIASVAEKVGYQSESSFLRIFKKTFNENAGSVRKMKHTL